MVTRFKPTSLDSGSVLNKNISRLVCGPTKLGIIIIEGEQTINSPIQRGHNFISINVKGHNHASTSKYHTSLLSIPKPLDPRSQLGNAEHHHQEQHGDGKEKMDEDNVSLVTESPNKELGRRGNWTGTTTALGHWLIWQRGGVDWRNDGEGLD